MSVDLKVVFQTPKALTIYYITVRLRLQFTYFITICILIFYSFNMSSVGCKAEKI